MDARTASKELLYSEQYILDKWVEESRTYAANGQTAAYIPALQNVEALQLGICIIEPNGRMLKSGEADCFFTLQSISKVISFIVACMHHSISYVLERVDVEPTGDSFNSIVRLEVNHFGKPFNPMINAGAITITSLLPGSSAEEKVQSVTSLLKQITGRPFQVDETVFKSEWESAHRNRALAYYLKDNGHLESDVEETLTVYLKQCAIQATIEDIALAALILSQDGYHPFFKKQVIPIEVAKLAKVLMVTCGMYNASGKFAAQVGIPAKSGVSGGIMALVLPNKGPFQKGCGIGIYGPAIDQYGNSLAGVKLLKEIASEWNLSIF
ncbi:glutaminase [Domibacillus sp. DTU_2020_1001157_1_SI_ALB_TIR_016]|uniref:glutaminase n=1 Tax=Domibacillus sp. DTU_2020_1001157_1_SI_ALB_TIR_016 TaxID=3077789 RepID=UPI0028E21A6E|nr:glutaminase [Domibacillus sp. DTU_2020_1001157_1_SI_ALB_TIR_016]WNS78141.1 glutaminase [Domibacillus sp. DTU_2020_1001157_1_SI_ALB_TIR_016]